MSTRALKIENLEIRQLMAGDGVDCTIDALGRGAMLSTAAAIGDDSNGSHTIVAPGYWYTAPSLISRTGSTVVVVTDVGLGKQALWGIREGGETGAEIAFQLDLGDVRAEQLLVDGDRLLVIGETGLMYPAALDGGLGANGAAIAFAPYQNKKVLAVNLTSGEIVKELELSSGYVKHAQFVDGKALLVVDPYNLNYPSLTLPVVPPTFDDTDDVFRFTWSASGVSDVAKDLIPSGQVAVAGDRLVVARLDHSTAATRPGELPSIELSAFTIASDDLVANGSVSAGTGYGSYLHLDSSGDRATLVRQRHFQNEPSSSQLLIFDLTTDAPSIDETIELGTSLQVLSQADDHVLLQDFVSGSLSLIDLGDDVNGDERVSEIDLPDGLLVVPAVIQLDDERLLMFAGPGLRPFPLSTIPVDSSRSTLLALSLTDRTIKAQELRDVSSATGLRLIDSADGRFGFETYSHEENGTVARAFVFGTLDNDGIFEADGEVEVATWYESFDADSTKLTVLTPSRVTAYDYDDTSEPLYSLRLVDADAPPLKAIDDTAEFYYIEDSKTSVNGSWDNVISVLANDQIPFGSRHETRITELIGAPDGVRIVDGQYLALSEDKFSEADKLVFSYKITDGFSESEAEIELTIKVITEELRDQMISAVKTQAAVDLGIPVEQLRVEFDIEFPFDRVPYPLPGVGAADGVTTQNTVLSQSPRFFARVTAPRVNAIYTVDVAGNAHKVWSLQVPIEPVVALTFAVTDADNKRIEKVEVGETFWLEFRGDDLRSFGQGVFSAYLNLDLVSNAIAGESVAVSFDGTVEPGPGMTLIDAGKVSEKITPASIRNLGVVSSVTDAPGGEPQLLLRVRVKANAVGAATFNSFASQNTTEENIVFGSTEGLSESEIRRGTAAIRIVEAIDEASSQDVDGDGKVHSLDALRVINFLARHGAGTIEQLEAKLVTAANGATPTVTTNISRFDVNRNGSVTPLDALHVINHMSRMNRQRAASGEGPAVIAEMQPSAVAASMIASDPAIEEQEQKRRANLKR